MHDLWTKSQNEGINSTFAQWEQCLVDLLDSYPRTTIVLDGLDECETAQRQNLINLLVSLTAPRRSAKPVKIFVSTRPDQDMFDSLEGMYALIDMQEKQDPKDIETFVRAKVVQHTGWSRMDPQFKEKMTHTLLKKSGDMFLFASLQIETLLDCWLEEDIRESLQRLPQTLAATYEEIYRRATKRPWAKKLTDRALRWVMCSVRPLTTDELLFAICLLNCM